MFSACLVVHRYAPRRFKDGYAHWCTPVHNTQIGVKLGVKPGSERCLLAGHSERDFTAKMSQEFSTGPSAPTPNTALRQLMLWRRRRLSLRTKSCVRSLSPNTSTGSAACSTMELPRTRVNPLSGSDPD